MGNPFATTSTRHDPEWEAEIRRCLSYDPETGVLTWIAVNSNRIKVGRRAGNIHGEGYREVSVGSRRILAHHLAWFLHHGVWAKELVDHINGDKSDDRMVNLREATYKQNAGNTRAHKDAAVPLKGVCMHVDGVRFKAQCRIAGRVTHLGIFYTAEEAHAAYMAAHRAEHGEFARSA